MRGEKNFTTTLLRSIMFLLMMVGMEGAWADVDGDSYMVPKNTGADYLVITSGSTLFSGEYTTLQAGFEGSNVFSVKKDGHRIDGTTDVTFSDGIPTGGHVFVFHVNRAGDFSFSVQLDENKTMCLRNSSGIDIKTKRNEGAKADYTDDKAWTVTVDKPGDYYLFGNGTQLGFYGYTFTPQPIQGITELPYYADFRSDTEPFEGGRSISTKSVGQVFSINNGTAKAWFKNVYVPKQQETVTVSFTAYHGWVNPSGNSTISLCNSENVALVSYTYNQKQCSVTDVAFGGESIEDFTAFFAQSNYNGSKSANSYGNNSESSQWFVSTNGYNPVITMTFTGSGDVSFRLKMDSRSIDRTFTSTLSSSIKKDIAYIKIEDTNTNEHRCIGIDNLSVTSQLYARDYENTGGMTDWVTGTGGRYTPTIMEEANGNHYMGVNQDQRNNNGTTLTNSTISGAAAAGEDFTLSFDMKLGNVDNNAYAQTPVTFIIYDATNTNPLFRIYAPDKNSTTWKLGVDENTSTEQTLALTGTGAAAINDLEWYHYKISSTTGRTYVTITSLDGTTTYFRHSFETTSTGGLGRLEFLTKRYNANFAFDNLNVAAYANTHFTQNGKEETYTITSEGDLKQTEEGKTIKLEYGTAFESQQTKTNGGNIGAFCIDKNKGDDGKGFYTRAWCPAPITENAPDVGTFYKFTPKYNGKLTIVGGVEDADRDELNKVTLRTANGSTTGTDFESTEGSAGMVHSFDMELQANTEYYLFAETEGTGHWDSSKGEWATLYLAGFTFTQTSMNREINVADLLYVNAKKQTNGLDRTIPGFELTFSGGNNVETVESGQQLKLTADGSDNTNSGTMTIKLRQNGHGAKIKNLIINAANAASNTKVTVNGTEKTIETGKNSISLGTGAKEVVIVCTAGNFRFTSITVGYQGYEDDNSNVEDNVNIATWLDEEKTTPSFTLAQTHIMRVPNDNIVFSNSVTFTAPNSFSVPVTYTSSDTRIATIDTDGNNGLLIASGEATITAAFAGTDYFAPTQQTYTVSNTLEPNETYERIISNGQVLKMTAYADGNEIPLTLDGGKTQEDAFTFGTTSSSKQTLASGEGTVTLKNGTSNHITIEKLSIFTSRPVAWLYYEGQEENYAEQMQFQGFKTGAIKGFHVLDIGDATDPVDLTDSYTWTENSKYSKTDDTNGILTDFNEDDGSSTTSISNEVQAANATEIEEGTFVYPKITRSLSRIAEKAEGYPDNLSAKNTIYVQLPPNEDTYKKWDFTAAITGNGQLDSRWRWDLHNYYQTWLPSYLPILNSANNPSMGNEGLLVYGDLRYHTGSNGLRLNLTSVNSHIKFPVKKDMEVAVELACASADVTNIITNALDIATGASINSLYVQNDGVNNNVTAYYRVQDDGCMEIHAMDNMGTFLKSITLERPQLHFTDDIITELASSTSRTVTYTPYNASEGASLTYSIRDDKQYQLSGAEIASAGDHIVTNINSSTGAVTLAGGTKEGWVTIDVVDDNATGVQPKKGSYRLYTVDFRFENLNVALPDLNATTTEVSYTTRPIGYDKVPTPITYTLALGDDDPRGHLVQRTGSTPAQTTYEMTAYSTGTYYVTATSSKASTTCTLTVGGYAFARVAPVLTSEEVTASGGVFTNDLPAGFTPTTVTYNLSGSATCGSATIEDGKVKLTGLSGYGAIRVNATNNKGTENTADDETLYFVLTLSYPASSQKKWNFYQKKNYVNENSSEEYGLRIGQIGPYNDAEHQTVENYTVTAINGSWTTNTNWEKVYRKGAEQPRWAYNGSVVGNNAFIIEETEGLQIEASKLGLYTDNPHQPTEAAYNHIGLYNHASVTIPRLKEGDYISLSMSRVIPNNGAILKATNVVDLEGNDVDQEFIITRAQTDYQEDGIPATNDDGSRFIPGYYTFRAKADGDVTFTLSDEGYLDLLSIEIYNEDKTREGSDPDNGYLYTMLPIKLDDQTTPPATILKEEDESESMLFTYCNVLWSTSVGPASYVARKSSNLDANVEKVIWYSPRGAAYEKGTLTVNEGYGKVTIRMNNYTAEGRYLIGYTPDYVLNVGAKPHQTYPHTWNFQNISGGSLNGNYNNVYNSIKNDGNTWTNNGNGSYTLNTNSASGSLYVPGAALVSTDRMLGTAGETPVDGKGFDELNGLGVEGSITLHTNNGLSAKSRDKKKAPELETYAPLDCTTETTLTLPDLNDGKQDWIYIKSSAKPKDITNAEEVTAAVDGPDAASGVYKYKVTSASKCNVEVTFTAGTTVSSIGVTHLFKPITTVGAEGWATESREHAIDYTLTDYFTLNAVKAYTVRGGTIEDNKATVRLQAVNTGDNESKAMPANTGMVLKLDDNTNLSSAKSGNEVPLFYPALTTPVISYESMKFDFDGNLMHPRLEPGPFYLEKENGQFPRFILAKRYMTWKKDGEVLHEPTQYESREAAVFYRMHLYTNDEAKRINPSADEYEHLRMNTLGMNKAYLVLPTINMPDALWDTAPSSGAPRRYIAIEGVSDMEELEELEEEERQRLGDGRIYNLRGQLMSGDEQTLPAGVYIRNGKKFVVK